MTLWLPSRGPITVGIEKSHCNSLGTIRTSKQSPGPLAPLAGNSRGGDFPRRFVEPRLASARSALGAATNTARDTVFPTLNGASVVVRGVPRPNTSQSFSPFGDTSVADPSGLTGREGVGGV